VKKINLDTLRAHEEKRTIVDAIKKKENAFMNSTKTIISPFATQLALPIEQKRRSVVPNHNELL